MWTVIIKKSPEAFARDINTVIENERIGFEYEYPAGVSFPTFAGKDSTDRSGPICRYRYIVRDIIFSLKLVSEFDRVAKDWVNGLYLVVARRTVVGNIAVAAGIGHIYSGALHLYDEYLHTYLK